MDTLETKALIPPPLSSLRKTTGRGGGVWGFWREHSIGQLQDHPRMRF